MKNLLRRTKNKIIGGVCGGFAKWLNIDTSVLRILFALALIFFGFGFWIYIICWIIIPEEE